MSLSFSALCLYPGIDLLFQHVKRQRAVLEHGGVEALDVESVAERPPRLVAKLQYFQLPDLVARRLARIVDVALDLLDDVALAEQRIVLEIADRLLAAPSLGVEAGVGDQPDRPPQFEREVAELRIGVLVEAHLAAEPLGVEAPALDIGAVAAEAAELGNPLELLLKRDLEMMAGRALMIADPLDLGLQHLVHVGEVDVIDSGPRAVGRGLV